MQYEEMVLMRIFLGESDRYNKQPLYQALVEFLREEGIAGATVIKGAMGYGHNTKIHTDRFLRLSSDLPVVIEVLDEQGKVDSVLPKIEEMLHGGLISLEKARVINLHKDK